MGEEKKRFTDPLAQGIQDYADALSQFIHDQIKQTREAFRQAAEERRQRAEAKATVEAALDAMRSQREIEALETLRKDRVWAAEGEIRARERGDREGVEFFTRRIEEIDREQEEIKREQDRRIERWRKR